MTLTAWVGTISFGPWWLLYCGPIRRSGQHAHNAVQITIHGGGPCIVDANGSMIHGPAAVIDPGRSHAVHGNRDHTAVVLVQPASRVGRRLQHWIRPPEPGPGHPVAEITNGLNPAVWSDTHEAVRRVLRLAGAPPPPEPPAWWHRPDATVAMLRLAAAATNDQPRNLATVAALVGVSVGELPRVVAAEIGMSVRAAAQWRRLMIAIEHLADGATPASAAEIGGYSDPSAFERDFVELFGATARLSGPAASWFS